jgi:hypothetical protein
MEDTVVLNGVEVTQEQLEEKKKKLEEQSGIKLVEVSKGEFKTRLQD